MANTPQAKKRIRRNEKRAEINGNRLGRIRTFVKKVEAALAGGDKAAAELEYVPLPASVKDLVRKQWGSVVDTAGKTVSYK